MPRRFTLLLCLSLLLLASPLVLAVEDEPILRLDSGKPPPRIIEQDGASWRELEKGETVAQGSHVRLDMTSGERWVKQAENQIDDGVDDLSRGRQILSLLQVDDALSPRIQAIENEYLETSDPLRFAQQASALWEERQALLRGEKERREEEEPLSLAGKLVAQLEKRQDVTQALESLDELVEEISFAKEFAHLKGLEISLGLAEEETLGVEERAESLAIVAKAMKWMPDLQASMAESEALGRALKLHQANPGLRSKAVTLFGAQLRGLGTRGVAEVERNPRLFPLLLEDLGGEIDAMNVRVRIANLLSDLILEEEGFHPLLTQAGFCNLVLPSANQTRRAEVEAFQTLAQHQTRLCASSKM